MYKDFEMLVTVTIALFFLTIVWHSYLNITFYKWCQNSNDNLFIHTFFNKYLFFYFKDDQMETEIQAAPSPDITNEDEDKMQLDGKNIFYFFKMDNNCTTSKLY